MKNTTILRKVIKKVNANGLDCEISGSGNVIKIFRGKEMVQEMPTVKEFIFSPEFAKAFWGTGKAEEQYENSDEFWQDTSCCSGSGCFFSGERWQYHFVKMVLAEDRVKYLEKFI